MNTQSRAVPIPDRDYSILSPQQLRLVTRRAQPPSNENPLQAEFEKSQSKHFKTQALVSGWKNTLKSQRMERQTRLQKEKEAEEQRKLAIDEEEKKVQKLKKQAALAEARKKSFAQRPEVRAVNAQLLLHEVQLERQAQETFKEQRKIVEMQRQIMEDEQAAERYRQMVEKEEKIKKERRQRAIEVAEGFRRQRELKQQRIQQEKEEQYEDDLFLRQEYIKQEEKDKEIARQKKLALRQQYEQSMRENKEMEFFKKRKREIEKAEDKKILDLAIQQMDEEDRRAEEEARKKREKLNARQALIDAEAARQAATKKVEEDFLEKQLAEQYQKEQAHIAEMTAKRDKLVQERRRDMQEAMRLQSIKQTQKKKKAYFPDESGEAAAQESFNRVLQKLQNQKDIAAYQRQQAQEKRDREAAEKERERLEYQAECDKEQEDILIAQEYARKLLATYKDDDY